MAKKIIGNKIALNVSSGGGDYEPDNRTIGVNANSKIEVKDYVSKKYVDELIGNNIIGSEFISFDLDPQNNKYQISFDFTNLNEFITFLDTQPEVVLSWDNISGVWKLRADLNQNISNKVNNSLQIPLTAPTNIELVGINTNKEQTRIEIGDGLVVVGNKLQTTERIHLFEHNMEMYNFDTSGLFLYNANLRIINTISGESWEWLKNNTEVNRRYQCSGVIEDNRVDPKKYYPVLYYTKDSNNNMKVGYIDDNNNTSELTAPDAVDYVRQII